MAPYLESNLFYNLFDSLFLIIGNKFIMKKERKSNEDRFVLKIDARIKIWDVSIKNNAHKFML